MAVSNMLPAGIPAEAPIRLGPAGKSCKAAPTRTDRAAGRCQWADFSAAYSSQRITAATLASGSSQVVK